MIDFLHFQAKAVTHENFIIRGLSRIVFGTVDDVSQRVNAYVATFKRAKLLTYGLPNKPVTYMTMIPHKVETTVAKIRRILLNSSINQR